MIEHRPSARPWPLSVLAMTIGSGDSDLLTNDSESFRRQGILFALLNFLLIAALLVLNMISRAYRGKPVAAVIVVLAVGLVIQAAHLAWLYRRTTPLSPSTRKMFTFWCLGFNSALALVLTSITLKGDTAYYALMMLPVLEAAFRLGLRATVAIIMVADFVTFVGAYGLSFGEYIEAGALSVIYTIMGVRGWLWVD